MIMLMITDLVMARAFAGFVCLAEEKYLNKDNEILDK